MYSKRWPYLENPFGFKMPDPPVVTKPLVATWEDLPDDQKEVVLGIRKVIQSFLGDCSITLFGSRLKGYWTDESDYDIIINVKEPDEETKKKILSYDYGVKVDLFFADRTGENVMLLVP
jgi:predicted nucleotidyltransferase